jgi:hypothetical protein
VGQSSSSFPPVRCVYGWGTRSVVVIRWKLPVGHPSARCYSLRVLNLFATILFFSGVWPWLESAPNSAALQAVTSVISVLVSAVTIYVLLITWRAVRRQALAAERQEEASRALIRVSEEQTKATINASAAAQEQSQLLSLQYEQSLAPLLVARLKLGGPGNAYQLLEIKNVGPGTAFKLVVMPCKVEVGARGVTYPMQAFSPTTLGSGESGEIYFNASPDGYVSVGYRGSDGNDRYTIIRNKELFWQEHWVRRGVQFVEL